MCEKRHGSESSKDPRVAIPVTSKLRHEIIGHSMPMIILMTIVPTTEEIRGHAAPTSSGEASV